MTTSFIDERPQLLTSHTSGDRGTKILTYLADVTVNEPNGPRPSAVYPNDKLPDIDLSAPPPSGSRQRLLDLGPHGFAAALRAQKALAVTDTTFRDAHQSLLATRVRTSGLLGVAGHVAHLTPQLLSIEAWAVRPTTWHCGSCTRIPGNASPRCGRPFRTSACRCCYAAATPSAAPLIRTRSRVRSSPKPRTRDRYLPDLRRARQH